MNRPGTGRPTATNGSPCVVPAGNVVIEAGVRSQQTLGPGVSTLLVAPMVAIRAGLRGRLEAIALPPAFTRRTGDPLVFGSASGAQDAGAGVKLQLRDRPFFQDAASLLYTAPTGSGGSNGFSAGGSTYTLAYAAGFSIGAIGITTTQQVVVTAAPGAGFTAYAPSLTVGVPLAASLTLLLSDSIATRTGPASGAGNRALAALQAPVGKRVVVDAEYELNALPAPGLRQHAFGLGAAFLVR